MSFIVKMYSLNIKVPTRNGGKNWFFFPRESILFRFFCVFLQGFVNSI